MSERFTVLQLVNRLHRGVWEYEDPKWAASLYHLVEVAEAVEHLEAENRDLKRRLDALQPNPAERAPSLADQVAAAHMRSAGLEIRVQELETQASQQKLRAVAESAYVSGLMVDLRALQAYEKDDRKAICENSGGLSVLEREVKHLRANLERNIERVDRMLAIQKATEEMPDVAT